MAGLRMHRRSHPHLYLLLLAIVIALVLLLLSGDTSAPGLVLG